MKECNEFETLFKDFLRLIEQGNNLVEELEAILRQGLALFYLLKQVFLV